MTLPLPYKISDPPDPTEVQGNFDEIAKQFPMSRRNLKVEAANVVGAAGQPAFQNSWVNYDTTQFYGLRFWKDSMGDVHIQGLVKSGNIGTVVFTLPAGYRPGNGIIYGTDRDGALHGRIDIAPTGQVVPQVGASPSPYYSLFLPPFPGEQ